MVTRGRSVRTDGSGSIGSDDDRSERPNEQGIATTERSIGRYHGIVTTLAEHTAIGGVHTFSVVEDDDGYVGYAGTSTDGPIDRWASANLERWQRTIDSPVIDRPGARWPTLLYDDGTYWMVVREATPLGGLWETSPGRWFARQVPRHRLSFMVDQVRRKISPARPTYVSLYASENGIKFEFDRRLVDPFSGGAVHNQNPFLLRDQESGVVLLYHRGNEDQWEIRYRRASSVPTLDDAEDVRLASSSELLAAPAAFYHSGRETYVLLVETIRDGDWYTEWVATGDLSTGFDPDDTRVLLGNDRACPFPHVEGQTLYLFVSRRLQGGILPRWTGEIHRYDVGNS